MADAKQKILIVDDEELVLKSLKREFMDADFETILAGSAKEGLDILEKTSVDVVITDVMMPEMDGLEFLEIVRDTYPGITRIILSGFVEEAMVISAITRRIATSYLTKPWVTKSFRKNIEQTLQLRKTLEDQALLSLISRIDNLPTLPMIYQEFEQAVAKDLSVKKIAGIVQEDVSISTRLLQVVNSAYYGQGKISSIDRAIMALGLKFVKDIVFTVSLIEQMNWTPDQNQHLEQIFLHSSLVSYAIKALYETAFGKKLEDIYASAGITHDIGRLILLQFFPERYEEVFAYQKENPKKDFYTCEIDLGYANMTHCELGAYFLNWWNLPDTNIKLALFHHAHIPTSDNETPEISEIFYYANLWVNLLMKEYDVEPTQISDFFSNLISEEKIREIEEQLMERIESNR